MYVNIAAGLVTMTRNTVYKPAWVNTSKQLKNPAAGSPPDYTNFSVDAMCGPGHWDKYPIFRILVAKNALSDYLIRFWLYNTPIASPVDIPYSAFVVGHTYDMFVNKYTIVDAGGNEITGSDANFILVGNLCSTMPIDVSSVV